MCVFDIHISHIIHLYARGVGKWSMIFHLISPDKLCLYNLDLDGNRLWRRARQISGTALGAYTKRPPLCIRNLKLIFMYTNWCIFFQISLKFMFVCRSQWINSYKLRVFHCIHHHHASDSQSDCTHDNEWCNVQPCKFPYEKLWNLG